MYYANKCKSPDSATGQMNLIFRARMIWRDLATWIRAYLISTYMDLGDLEAVKKKMLQLPAEYGNVFRLIFGDQIAEKYTSMLFESFHILMALAESQKNGDIDAVNANLKLIYENADQRSKFLSEINPFWQESEWKNLIYELIRLTIDESNALLSKDYTKSIEMFDRILVHSLKIGDYFADGLFKYLNYSNRQINIPK